MDAVVTEFVKMYGKPDVHLQVDVDVSGAGSEDKIPWREISKGVEELRSKEWIYGQTPRFSFNSADGSSVVDAALLPPTSVRQVQHSSGPSYLEYLWQ
jgi:hypothetical protein